MLLLYTEVDYMTYILLSSAQFHMFPNSCLFEQ